MPEFEPKQDDEELIDFSKRRIAVQRLNRLLKPHGVRLHTRPDRPEFEGGVLARVTPLPEPIEDVEIRWSDEKLAAARISRVRLARLIRRLKHCSRELQEMGLHVASAGGKGHLIHESQAEVHPKTGKWSPAAVVADVGPGFGSSF